LQTLRASDNHGRFRTKGRYSSATVRGTRWTTSDLCDGTLTTVQRGTVQVFDDVTRKTITLHAGHSYLAKAFTSRTK
jgi:ferric-dicitrate binding protein FerR (iron transport regulator)